VPQSANPDEIPCDPNLHGDAGNRPGRAASAPAQAKPQFYRRTITRIFLSTVAIRLCVSTAILLLPGPLHKVSRDSYWFHDEAIRIASQYAEGTNDWSLWIDNGWPQFIGALYHILGETLFLVALVNALLAGWATVLLYRVAVIATGEQSVAKACGYAFAFFPSAVFFHALPLKECSAVIAILGIVWGIISIRVMRAPRGWLWLILGLLIIAALRVYLVPVLGVCIAIGIVPIRLSRSLSGIVAPALCGVALLLTIFLTVTTMEIDVKEYESLQYFDLDKLNSTRRSLSRGTGKIFTDRSQAEFGSGVVSDVRVAATGVFFFLCGVNVFDLRSSRQIMAVPEMMLMLLCIRPLIVGFPRIWRRNPRAALPIIVFMLAIIATYGAGTTNMGAMYRWRLQALPFLLLVALYGASCLRRGVLYKFVSSFQRRQPIRRIPNKTRNVQCRDAQIQ